MKKILQSFLKIILIVVFVMMGYHFYFKYQHENEILKQVIARLEADSRVGEVLVTGVNLDEKTSQTNTTIKFLEYDSQGQPLQPKYFTFSGNIIQFQALVIRFDDIFIRNRDKMKGKSAYIFWKVFMLDGKNTQEYEVTKMFAIPEGYKIKGIEDPFEEKLWKSFWSYALDPKQAKQMGLKNAQIEAPGTMFIPGHLYTIKIEHDGGLRIDAQPLPSIIQGENIPNG